MFKERVINYIKKIPKGRVVSYGQVAAACGHPLAARQVGGILRNLDITFLPRIYSGAKTPWKGRSEAGRKGKPFRAKRAGFPSEFIPWWRVVNSRGVISIKGNWAATKEYQAELLKKEGIEVGKDFKIDMQRYRYY